MNIQVVINKMIILFLVIIIGYIANKVGILDKSQNQKLSSLILNITSPALILASVSDIESGDFNIYNFDYNISSLAVYGDFIGKDFKST